MAQKLELLGLDMVEIELSPLEDSAPDKLHMDLLNMMKFNYPNERSFSALPSISFYDLKHFCCHGIVYGAVQTCCISCHGILCPFHIEGHKHMFRCLNQGRSKLSCRNDKYYEVAFSSWKIPPSNEFQHPDMKQAMDEIRIKLSDKCVSQSIDTEEGNEQSLSWCPLKGVEKGLDAFFEGHLKIEGKEYKIYEKNEDDVKKSYGYFLINRPDLSDNKYSFSQILVQRNSGDLTSSSKCMFYTYDWIYEKPKSGIQRMTIEDAIRWFEEKFNLNTGIYWLSWCRLCSGEKVEIDRNCFSDNKYMLPLKIDYQHKEAILSKLGKRIPMVLGDMLQY